MARLRLGILASHPIQYQAPVFRELSKHTDVVVYFAHRQTPQGQASAGFGVAFDWDVDLLGGYEHHFLENVARTPGVDSFWDSDTPGIDRAIRDGGFDAFLVQGWYLKSYWQAALACRRYQVPVMVRGDSQLATTRARWYELVKDLIYPFLLSRFDACLYVGQNNRAYLEHYGVPPNKLYFSPHCIDDETFSAAHREIDRADARAKHGIGEKDKVVLFVGKLMERKRPLDIVRAIHRLVAQGMVARMMIAGDGTLREEIRREGEALGVPIVFLGFRNQTELPEVYAMADVLVLPSDGSETWGLVVNEALACGVPAVVSDRVGCAPDLVLPGISGVVHAFGDTASLSEAIASVLGNPPATESIRQLSDRYSVRAAADGIMYAARCLRGETT